MLINVMLKKHVALLQHIIRKNLKSDVQKFYFHVTSSVMSLRDVATMKICCFRCKRKKINNVIMLLIFFLL